MWDTAETTSHAAHVAHDMPCQRCGHAAHTFLPCSDSCTCVPAPPPGIRMDEGLLIVARAA